MYKSFSLVFMIAAVAAELPAWSYTRFDKFESGPYPPSGWRPSGPEFRLPVPHTSYGPPPKEFLAPPSQEYGPPSQEYGPPTSQEPTTTETGVTTTEQSTTTESATETATEATTEVTTEATIEVTTEDESANSLDGVEQSQKLTQPAEEQGVYFIYHPTGLLQRVVYTTSDDKSNMAYSASFKYENVEPITGPIYTYDPQTLVFQRVNLR